MKLGEIPNFTLFKFKKRIHKWKLDQVWQKNFSDNGGQNDTGVRCLYITTAQRHGVLWRRGPFGIREVDPDREVMVVAELTRPLTLLKV
jgi:hypothetical protein